MNVFEIVEVIYVCLTKIKLKTKKQNIFYFVIKYENEKLYAFWLIIHCLVTTTVILQYGRIYQQHNIILKILIYLIRYNK